MNRCSKTARMDSDQKRSCHTALRSVQKGWTGTKWFIDIDIKGYFNTINHDILMKLREKKIEDAQFSKPYPRYA